MVVRFSMTDQRDEAAPSGEKPGGLTLRLPEHWVDVTAEKSGTT
jgi:hypothetical protein